MTTPIQSGPKLQHADYRTPAQVIMAMFSNDVQPYKGMKFQKTVIESDQKAQDLTKLSLAGGTTLSFFDRPDRYDYLLEVAQQLTDFVMRARK
jgi:hypothetical protein